jgi:serine/threonine protein kinase
MNLLKPKYEIGGKKYVSVRQIGEGAYAFVYRVKPAGLLGGGGQFALKRLVCQSPEQLDEAKKEIRLLTDISHPGVLRLVGSELHYSARTDITEALLLMPLYTSSVQDVIDAGPGFPRSAFRPAPARLLRILVRALEGLSAVHERGFRHGDFKPANILLRLAPRDRGDRGGGGGGGGDRGGDRDRQPPPEEDVVLTDLGSACPLCVSVASRAQALVRERCTTAAITITTMLN